MSLHGNLTALNFHRLNDSLDSGGGRRGSSFQRRFLPFFPPPQGLAHGASRPVRWVKEAHGRQVEGTGIAVTEPSQAHRRRQ